MIVNLIFAQPQDLIILSTVHKLKVDLDGHSPNWLQFVKKSEFWAISTADGAIMAVSGGEAITEMHSSSDTTTFSIQRQ